MLLIVYSVFTSVTEISVYQTFLSVEFPVHESIDRTSNKEKRDRKKIRWEWGGEVLEGCKNEWVRKY